MAAYWRNRPKRRRGKMLMGSRTRHAEGVLPVLEVARRTSFLQMDDAQGCREDFSESHQVSLGRPQPQGSIPDDYEGHLHCRAIGDSRGQRGRLRQGPHRGLCELCLRSGRDWSVADKPLYAPQGTPSRQRGRVRLDGPRFMDHRPETQDRHLWRTSSLAPGGDGHRTFSRRSALSADDEDRQAVVSTALG